MANPEIDVRYVADLARLKLTEDEASRFEKQLGDILNYINQLQKVDVSGVETAGNGPLVNQLREDEPDLSNCLPVEKVMANAPAHENNLIIVPKIVES